MNTDFEQEHFSTQWWAVGALALAACVILWFSHTGERWVPLLDSANLAFHEAGHLIYGVLGDSVAVYGGTLGQLTFPVLAMGIFYRRREANALACASLWLGENLFNIARYMGDARDQLLPLIGGDHDWTEILSRWGWLSMDSTLAAGVRLLGWLVIIATILFLALAVEKSET